MDSPHEWLAWFPPACVLAGLIGLAILGFFPRPPRH